MSPFILDSKKSRTGAKVTKGSHGSSNAYMLVYSRRDTSKPESDPACSPISPPDPCSVLPPWVQTTIFNENKNFEAWNRNTVSRKVSPRTSLLYIFRMVVNLMNFFTRTKVWGRAEKCIPKWDACTAVFPAPRWNKANLFLPSGYWVGWEMTRS